MSIICRVSWTSCFVIIICNNVRKLKVNTILNHIVKFDSLSKAIPCRLCFSFIFYLLSPLFPLFILYLHYSKLSCSTIQVWNNQPYKPYVTVYLLAVPWPCIYSRNPSLLSLPSTEFIIYLCANCFYFVTPISVEKITIPFWSLVWVKTKYQRWFQHFYL